MSQSRCRDCGYLLNPTSRGCPQCALNLEAERKVDRVFWRGIVPAIVALVIIASVLLFRFVLF
jgi:hypothetical protein